MIYPHPMPTPAALYTCTYLHPDVQVIDTLTVTHNTPFVKTPHMAFLVDRKVLIWSLSNMLRIMPAPILLFPNCFPHIFSHEMLVQIGTSQALGPMHSHTINGL